MASAAAFLPIALDVVRLVGDVRDVDVDQVQADLVQLRLDVLADRLQEALAVLVDLLDGQRRDGEAQLAEDDFLGHVLDFLGLQTQEPLGSVVHDRLVRADADGERARHVDADVLHRQRVLQRDADRHGRQAHVSVVLDQRPDECATAVDAAGRLVTPDLAIDDQDTVGGTPFVPRGQEQQCRDHQQNEGHGRNHPQSGRRFRRSQNCRRHHSHIDLLPS